MVAASPPCTPACLRSGHDRPAPIPGPRATGGAGRSPRVTDADLVLGYLAPTGLAGGVQVSPREHGTRSTQRWRVRWVSTRSTPRVRARHRQRQHGCRDPRRDRPSGIDPRTFVMVAFGGAGPMHACRIADEFGIGKLAVPWGAGVASAIGLAHADPGAEWRRPFAADLDTLDATALASGLDELEQRARGGDRSRWRRRDVRGRAVRRDARPGPGARARDPRRVATASLSTGARFVRLRRALRRGVRRGARIPAPTDLGAVRCCPSRRRPPGRRRQRRAGPGGYATPARACARTSPSWWVRDDAGVRLDRTGAGEPARGPGDRRGTRRHRGGATRPDGDGRPVAERGAGPVTVDPLTR